MLRQIRRSAESPFVKFFLVLLALSFVGWGVGDYITGGRSNVALQINNQTVSLSEVSTAYQNELAALQRQIGFQLPPEMLEQTQLGAQVITGIIQRKLQEQEAAELGIDIADEELKEVITNTQAFQTAGQFNAETYKQILSTYGLTTEAYEKTLRSNLVRNRLNALFDGPAGVKEIINRLLTFEQEGIEVETISVKFEAMPKPQSVTQEELEEAYKQTNLQTVETRSAEALVLDPTKLDQPQATAGEVEAYYTANQARFQTEEERRARHILVKTEDEANDLYQKLKADAGIFAGLARTNSQDPGSAPNGGDLGFFSRGAMVAEFEEAAFNLNVNEISAPVKSAFGYHIIQLTDVKTARTKPLNEVKEEITKQLIAQKAEEALYSIQTDIEDRIASGEALQEIAKSTSATNYETYKNKQLDENGISEILETVFQTETTGEVSEVITLADGRLAFIQVTEITPARSMTQEEAKKELTAQIKRNKQKQAAQQAAQKHINAWQKGQKVAGSTTHPVVLRTGENAPEWLKTDVINALFKLKPGQALAQPILADDAFISARLVKKHAAQFDDVQLESSLVALNVQMNNDLRLQTLLNRFENSKVSYNIPALKQVFGENFTGQNLPQPTKAPWYAVWRHF